MDVGRETGEPRWRSGPGGWGHATGPSVGGAVAPRAVGRRQRGPETQPCREAATWTDNSDGERHGRRRPPPRTAGPPQRQASRRVRRTRRIAGTPATAGTPAARRLSEPRRYSAARFVTAREGRLKRRRSPPVRCGIGVCGERSEQSTFGPQGPVHSAGGERVRKGFELRCRPQRDRGRQSEPGHPASDLVRKLNFSS